MPLTKISFARGGVLGSSGVVSRTVPSRRGRREAVVVVVVLPCLEGYVEDVDFVDDGTVEQSIEFSVVDTVAAFELALRERSR